MRLLTYNVHYWAGLDGNINVRRVIRILRDSQAHVVGLNEVLHPLQTAKGAVFPLIEVAAALGMHWAFGPSFEQKRALAWPGLLGNAVLSRYPIRGVQNILLRPVSWRKPRSVLRVTLEVEGHVLEVLVTHLEHLLIPVRHRQFEQLARVLRATRRPHVLMGDFNTHTPVRGRIWAGEPFIQRLRSWGYVDAFAAVGTGDGRSYPSRFPLTRLDYIWVPKPWDAGLRRAWLITGPTARIASDHYPLVVEWAWPTSRVAHEAARSHVERGTVPVDRVAPVTHS